MEKTKRILCGLTALLLCGGLMGGCGTKEQTADTDSAELVQEDSVPVEEIEEAGGSEDTDESEADDASDENKTNSKAEDTAKESSAEDEKEVAAARKVLESFLEGCVSGDTDAILDATNLREALELMDGEDFNEDELKESVAGLAELFGSYEILSGQSDPENLDVYNEAVEELIAEAQTDLESADDETRAEIETVLKVVKPLDGLCWFTVMITDPEGVESSEDMYVIKTDGKWSLDMILIDAMIGYIDHDSLTEFEANAAAKTVYNAFNAALADMDAEGYDVTLLEGDYSFTGDDFENLTSQETDVHTESVSELLETVQYYISQYFSDIEKLESIEIRISDGGICEAVAVETAEGSFGSYPNQVDADNDEITTIEQAFANAVDVS